VSPTDGRLQQLNAGKIKQPQSESAPVAVNYLGKVNPIHPSAGALGQGAIQPSLYC